MDDFILDFSELLLRYNVTQTQISEKFGIPLRTVQHWKAGTRKCPDYIIDMIDQIYKLESRICALENEIPADGRAIII